MCEAPIAVVSLSSLLLLLLRMSMESRRSDFIRGHWGTTSAVLDRALIEWLLQIIICYIHVCAALFFCFIDWTVRYLPRFALHLNIFSFPSVSPPPRQHEVPPSHLRSHCAPLLSPTSASKQQQQQQPRRPNGQAALHCLSLVQLLQVQSPLGEGFEAKGDLVERTQGGCQDSVGFRGQWQDL